MDKISGFSDDELLVKILSFLPTKDAVSTSTLSKQWKFLWMRVPKLDYDEKSIEPKQFDSADWFRILSEKRQSMRRFIDRNLPLHSSPVIQSLRLSFLTEVFQPEDIRLWIEIAVSRCVEDLSVDICPLKIKRNALLPSSLYTCKSLVTLKLRYTILVDVPHVVCLPSLKALHLRLVTYANEESLQRLLSNCSLLEDLVVKRRQGDNVKKFSVIIPSLVSLSFSVTSLCSSDGYIIDTPSLKYFEAIDFSRSSTCSIVKNMPKLEEAKIRAGHHIKKLLKPVASVKRLSLWVQDNSAEAVYDDDIVFNKLEHLNFGIIKTYWSKLLFWLLNASPKVRDFTFNEQASREGMGATLVCWKQLISVPQCLLSSLQTFKWSGFLVSVQGKDLATYILRKSCLLKTATISLGPGLDPQENLEMETEVKFSSPSSPTRNLVFNQDWGY